MLNTPVRVAMQRLRKNCEESLRLGIWGNAAPKCAAANTEHNF
ncbi:hypothetical protein BRCON_2292 [Candidatus Sumerlaea chitinivorans]|uniref:Uncharacterized protein n=1 Tax=Sumerlaea chitinivorans TaxID=2250252 RepID=A0A2Z4Y862_SUMC1|nr:hypothetical protein BRCON_2292 [Candidatus Sumerlaea chitinivorans]